MQEEVEGAHWPCVLGVRALAEGGEPRAELLTGGMFFLAGDNVFGQIVAMGRMHSNGKGLSRSAAPYVRSAPSWLKITSAEVGEDSWHWDETQCMGWCSNVHDGLIGRRQCPQLGRG